MVRPAKTPIHSDEENLQLLKAGDELAFEFIYETYAERLFSFIYGKVKSKETTEEIIQEIFVSLWASRETLQIRSSLEAYLFGAAKNKILSFVRTEQVRKKYAEEFTRFAAGQCDNSLLDEVIANDLQQSLLHKVADLPDKCQAAFRMSRMEHQPIPQIAEKMNISTRTVENYISQALKYLRTSLGEFLSLLLGISVSSTGIFP
jgi:RNA polymerase sigma-70 factor (ECF subfamily)